MTKALQNHAWIKDPFTYNKAFKKKIKKKKNLEEITKKFNVTDFNVTLISPTKSEPKPIKLKINTKKIILGGAQTFSLEHSLMASEISLVTCLPPGLPSLSLPSDWDIIVKSSSQLDLVSSCCNSSPGHDP